MQCIVAHRPNSRAGRNCGLQRRTRLFAHTHRFKKGIHSLHHKFQNRSTSFRDFIPRNSSKQWNSRAPVVAQYSISLQSRRCSRCEPCSHPRPSPLSNFCELPRSVCNAEFLQTILDLVLQLVDLILILELLCLLHHPINYGLRQLLSSSGMAIQSDLSWAYTFKFFLRFCHADWR